MKQVRNVLAFALVTVLVAGALGSPVLAAKSGVLKGTLVSYDKDTSKMVVLDEDGGDKVTLTTSKRTTVEGLNPASGDMQSVEVLNGLKDVQVTVKWKETGDGPEARFVRVFPHKQS